MTLVISARPSRASNDLDESDPSEYTSGEAERFRSF